MLVVMSPNLFFITLVILINFCTVSDALLEGIYCGNRICYDVLEITRDAGKSDIVKAYRNLAKKYHPDRHTSAKSKEEAEQKFRDIATAYEILRDEESRKEYDYMLDNPDEVYRHYYHYYRRRLAPKVDVRIVILVSITIISIVQYYSLSQRYSSAIDCFVMTEKYRHQALQIAEQEKMLPESGRGKNRKSKEELKKEKEAVIRKIIEDKMDIQGSYAKPSIKDILWVQLIMLPLTTATYIIWYSKWVWKFYIKKEEYGREEKLYIIRKNLGKSEVEFLGLDASKHEEYLRKELWNKDKFEEWKKREEEEVKAKLAEDSRYKRYRRFMKNHGPGQITFDD